MIRRKQYIALAGIIRKYRILNDIDNPICLRDLVTDIAIFLKKDNPTFDRSKFMREAGYYDE